MQLLKDSHIREFRIEIEADTLAQIDEATEKEEATEITKSISGFFEQALPVAQNAPELLPLMGAILTFGLRRFKAGRTLESAVESGMKALEAKAAKAAGRFGVCVGRGAPAYAAFAAFAHHPPIPYP